MFFHHLLIILVSILVKNDSFVVKSNSFKNKLLKLDDSLDKVTNSKNNELLLKSNDKVILFDGICNFCNTWVDLLLRIDTNKQYIFTPLQGVKGKELLKCIGKDEDDISSVLLIEKSSSSSSSSLDFYEKSDCVLQVINSLGLPAQIVTTTTKNLLPLEFRDTIYDMVAENRYNFLGKRDTCRCSDPHYADRFI